MTKLITIAVFILVLLAAPGMAQTSTARNLSLYETVGPYDVGWDATHFQKMKTIRAFIWSHYLEKRRSKLIATLYTREGDPSTNTFFIEPNAQDRWVVVCEYTGINYPRWGDKSRPRRFRGSTVYDAVTRHVIEKDGRRRLVANDESLDSSSVWQLWLENSGFKDFLVL